MLEVTINAKPMVLEKPTSLLELSKGLDKKYYAAKVNNSLKELNSVIAESCDITFLDLTSPDSVKIYEATLRYIFLMAVKNLYPERQVRFSYSISRSIFVMPINFKIDEAFTKNVLKEMKRIISLDLAIIRKRVKRFEIIDYFDELGYTDKGEIMRYRDDEYANVYECDGYKNYLYERMLPSTGYIDSFKMFSYYPGIILQYPRAELSGLLPKFVDAPRFSKHISESRKWAELINVESISKINRQIKEKKEIDLINICETRHNRMLYEIGQRIQENKDNIRLIAIAGPSSSGKTTFSNRLRIELLSRGIKPVKISIDDYYLPRSAAPKDIDGNPDLEHIEALDIDLFNEHILALISGEEVTMPRFDFKTGLRVKGETIKVNPNDPIIIEGIHALNERLTASIPRHQKFKIFIAPLQQINICNHSPISITEIRLLRRIVRDKNYRNTDVNKTLEMWPSVRRGEFNWIYDTQEDADYIFNSELAYEMCVMKRQVLPMLLNIDKSSKCYSMASRLIRFLKYFEDMDDTYIPCNSLIREFIGGSCFEL